MNPYVLPLAGFLDEVTALNSAVPAPQEVLIKGVHIHRWAEGERDARGIGGAAVGCSGSVTLTFEFAADRLAALVSFAH